MRKVLALISAMIICLVGISNVYAYGLPIGIPSSATPSGTPVFSTGPLSYSLTSPSYSSTHSGIGYVTLTVGVGGSTTVYVSTASAKATFVSPYGWKNIDDLVAQPIYAYN